MSKEKEVNPDSAHLTAENPDDFGFFNPATIGSYSKVQLLEAELAKEKALKEAYKIDYAIEETDDEITERMVHNRAVAELEHLYTEEGFEGWKQATEDMLGVRAEKEHQHPQAESDRAYMENVEQRARRLAREEEERKRDE
jgi:hypothetical protein